MCVSMSANKMLVDLSLIIGLEYSFLTYEVGLKCVCVRGII